MVFDLVSDFIRAYYLSPGYNIVNTLTYGIVLGYLVFKALIPALKPFLGDFDRRFALMLVPFIIYGASLRELVDQDLGVYAGNTQYPANYMLVAPGIFFTMFALTFACIVAGKLAAKAAGGDWRTASMALGWMLCAYNMFLIVANVTRWENLVYVMAPFTLITGMAYMLKDHDKFTYLGFEGNFLLLAAHLFDASTTFIGIDVMGYVEKHVVPIFFIDLIGTAAVMYPLKLIVLLPAIYVIDDEMKDDKFGRRFVKFVIFVLGMGPGIRNMTMLLMG
jgi:uncharacterized membrane protein